MSGKDSAKVVKLDKDEQLQQLFERLDDLVSKNNLKKALKAAEDILKVSKKDSDALSVKAVILVQLYRSLEALKLLESAGTQVQETLAFVKAYALYRIGDYDSALSLINSGHVKGIGGLQLEALLCYHTGAFEKAAELYDKIVQEQNKSVWEVKTNQVAAYVSAGKAAQITSLKIGNASQYEIVYNQACGEIQLQNYKNAEQLLQKSLRLGQETLLGEDWSQEEADVELATIRAQLAFVQYQLGQQIDVEENLSELLKMKGLDDEIVRYISVNNLWAAGSGNSEKKGQGIGEGRSLLKYLSQIFENGSNFTKFSASLQKRLSSAQKLVLCCNVVILLLLANRKDDCRSLLDQIGKEFADSGKFGTLSAFFLAKEGKFQDALDALGNSQNISPDNVLLQVQLLAMNKQPQQAFEILQSSKFSNSPAVISTLVTMKEQQQDFSGAEQVLQNAIKNLSDSPSGIQWCTQKLAEIKLKQDQFMEAMKLFEQLRQISGNGAEKIDLDVFVRSKLAQAVALLDPSGAQELVEQSDLDDFEQNLNVDIDFIENNLGNLGLGGKKRGQGQGQGGEEGGVVKKKRKRKPRYPKGFDPENPGPPPDPERWLPKWERSDYKKKNRRRKDKDTTVKGTQGGIVDEALDASQFSHAETSSVQDKKPKLPTRPKGVKGRRK